MKNEGRIAVRTPGSADPRTSGAILPSFFTDPASPTPGAGRRLLARDLRQHRMRLDQIPVDGP
ncbi:hypothetical protein [Rathayibacter tanaceti]|uniref:Uncharacterized protein n=1 Tax=Rathayibacter tanaceti TaxID=1671680 RepID=A0AAE6RMQ7_9MICO|nr:hypothetical protein [Rathayibacter tanaceti]QHC56738.1 hypothetical protein GSU10_14615 [Rathayibacter tanaceti]